jgi:hypothetical protein
MERPSQRLHGRAVAPHHQLSDQSDRGTPAVELFPTVQAKVTIQNGRRTARMTWLPLESKMFTCSGTTSTSRSCTCDSRKPVMSIATSSSRSWPASGPSHRHDIAPTPLPTANRIYADRRIQVAYDARTAGARHVAQMLRDSPIGTEALREHSRTGGDTMSPNQLQRLPSACRL